MDPLSQAENGTGGSPPNWVGFDEFSATSPPIRGVSSSSDRQHRPFSGNADEISNGTSTSMKEEEFELETTERALTTSLPTKEVIADPSTLDQAPVVEASQEFHGKGPVIVTRDMDQLNDIHNHNRTKLVNGKIVATIYPENTMCSWVIPPRYDPYTIPAVLTSECFSVDAS
ncbi:hypothetical protein KIN20_008790 [Parelaphostrongylus tenuis]|uniref:Uncharacterized protein n=1 Tax=Parelaphostrongylus tenuis TaxID=148309 RepID=A0AAD5M5B3_PARTN|nr:hypothetical protein KIN20_008790 [Parelaphostrongylus tenuis]